MLQRCTAGAWGGTGWRDGRMARGRAEPTNLPTNTTLSGSGVFAQGN